MPILRIQHAISSYDGWRKAFDADPIGRKQGGVRSYQVHRDVADPNFIMIDLHFDDLDRARAFMERLHALWAGPAKAVMRDAQAWIVETVESQQL